MIISAFTLRAIPNYYYMQDIGEGQIHFISRNKKRHMSIPQSMGPHTLSELSHATKQLSVDSFLSHAGNTAKYNVEATFDEQIELLVRLAGDLDTKAQTCICICICIIPSNAYKQRNNTEESILL